MLNNTVGTEDDMTGIRNIGYACALLGIAGSVTFPVLTNLTDYRRDFSLGGWISMALCLVGCTCLALVTSKARKKT